MNKVTIPEIKQLVNLNWNIPLPSLKKSFDLLFKQLDRYITEKRQAKSQNRKDIDKQGKSDITGNLDQAVENKQQETFIFLLKPYLDSLRKIARREIYNLESKENIRLGIICVEDLINETILRAWRDYRKKVKGINLDQWLVQILFHIIKQAAEQEKKFLGLSDALKPAPMDDVGVDPDFDSDQWWWSRIEPTEGILWEDLLPGEESPESFRQITKEEENKRLMDALGQLSEEDRQIISLHALDGYDFAEIAKIKNKPLKNIKDIIEKSRDKIREILQKKES